MVVRFKPAKTSITTSATPQLELKSFTQGGATFVRPEQAKKEAARAVQQQVAAQESKMAAESRRNKNKAKLQLIQTGILYNQMADWNKKNIPAPLRAGRLEGAANVFFGRALGKNPYVGPFEGDQVETAAALMKIAAPSARGGERLIEMFQKTLPNIWAVKPEAKEQLSSSMANSIYQDAVTHPEDYPDLKLGDSKSEVKFALETRKRMAEAVDLMFETKELTKNMQMTGTGILMKAPDGSVEEVPFNQYANAKSDGYVEVKR